jgi:hypothetical protein
VLKASSTNISYFFYLFLFLFQEFDDFLKLIFLVYVFECWARVQWTPEWKKK